MKKLLRWLVGGICLIGGIAALFTNAVFGGLILIAISILLIPPFVNYLGNKLGFNLSLKIRIVPLILLFFIALIYFGIKSENENIEYFTLNKDIIITELQANIDAGDFDAARDNSEKYLASKDEELQKLYDLISQKESEKRERDIQARKSAIQQIIRNVDSEIGKSVRDFPHDTEVNDSWYIATIKLTEPFASENTARMVAVDLVQIIHNALENTILSDRGIRVSLRMDARPGFVTLYGSARLSSMGGDIQWDSEK